MDGSYLVDERDGEMGGVRTESRDSSDAEDNNARELGLGANLARVGSLSGKVTTVSSNEGNLHRRPSTKKSSGRLVAVKLTPRGASSQRDAEKERVAFVREVEVLRVSIFGFQHHGSSPRVIIWGYFKNFEWRTRPARVVVVQQAPIHVKGNFTHSLQSFHHVFLLIHHSPNF